MPLRTKAYPTFRSAARYEVTSTSTSADLAAHAYPRARWAALYTIASNALYTEPSYVALRSNRSAREGELLARVATLDRRIYKLLSDSDNDNASGSSGSTQEGLRARTAEEVRANAPIVVATSVTLVSAEAQRAYDEWYEQEHLPLLKKVPGWKRTRRFVLLDALINGKLAGKENADGKTVPTQLGLHGEWKDMARACTSRPDAPSFAHILTLTLASCVHRAPQSNSTI